MELNYTQKGDYLYPELEVPEAPKIGKFGRLRETYLIKHRNGIYTGLLATGELNSHLEKTDEQANAMLEQLISNMARKQGVTEQLKAEDQMKWVGMMNNIRASAEEIVLKELIYK